RLQRRAPGHGSAPTRTEGVVRAGVIPVPLRRGGVFLAALTLSTLWVTLFPATGEAQSTGRILGQVISAETGEGLENATVFIQGVGQNTLTGASGRFLFSGVPPGEHTLTVERLGYGTESRTVQVEGGAAANVEIELTERAVQVAEILVTATREAQLVSEIAASVGVVGREALAGVRPSHPSEVMNDVPGVWVNQTSGEGHMTAIRQPLSTDPVYLYLEDGVPTRSTGFFNHNALYEVNVPQSQRIEVMKGPANALYGSDAIGGVINVATRAPTGDRSAEATLEGGEHGYGRVLASASDTWGEHGVRADLNLTRMDGWREGTAYDRIAATARWDAVVGGGFSAKTILSLSRIDQNTAGSSALSREDYLSNPTLNYTPISFREVGALRLSTELERRSGDWSFSVTPFFRSNSMDILPNWSLTYDPAVGETDNRSYGALAKVRRDFGDLGLRVVGGVDLDYSPGGRVETRVSPVREGAVFTDFTLADRLYDYDVTFRQVAPYLHAELAPTDRLNLTAGLRADFLGYDYENHLSVVNTGSHRRPPDASPTFQAVSPKFGATFRAAPAVSLFGAVRRGFRAPAEGDLFRQGSAQNTLGLEPVKTWSYEAGARGTLGDRIRYDLSVYAMTKTDDILGYELPDGNQETVNAGETRHRGVELGLGVGITDDLRVDVAYTVAEHTYHEWSPEEGVDFAGNEMQFAPNQMGSADLSYEPSWLPGARASLEWVRVGPYWEDQQNEHEYEGHDLLNLNLRYAVTDGLEFFGRLENVADERFAERASYNAFRGEELAPGLPRTLRIGVSVQ
ncbi:MAG: TonB-dependent receptor, partial [Gemmatimonadota bacterium]